MSKLISILAFVILVSLGIFGAWLAGFFETTDPSADISGWDLLKTFSGFLILVAASIGIILIIRRNLDGIAETDATEWNAIRKKGKRRYILIAVLKGAVLGLVGLVPLIVYQSGSTSFELGFNRLWFYAAIFLACIFATFTAAVRSWNANKKDFHAVDQCEPEE